MSDQLDADALRMCAAYRAAIDDIPIAPLNGGAPGGKTFDDLLISALTAEFGAPQGHQADAAERAGAYRQYATARARLYGQLPASEDVRASLTPASASPMVRRIFGG